MANQLIFFTEYRVFIYDQYFTQSASQVRRREISMREIEFVFLLVLPTCPPASSISGVGLKMLCTNKSTHSGRTET